MTVSYSNELLTPMYNERRLRLNLRSTTLSKWSARVRLFIKGISFSTKVVINKFVLNTVVSQRNELMIYA